MRLAYVDYHTCGEPVRIVTSGYPELTGASILEKRRQEILDEMHRSREQLDCLDYLLYQYRD